MKLGRVGGQRGFIAFRGRRNASALLSFDPRMDVRLAREELSTCAEGWERTRSRKAEEGASSHGGVAGVVIALASVWGGLVSPL
jgi:hypothetical protein